MVLGERPDGERILGRCRRRWEDNIKTDLENVRWGCMDCIALPEDRESWRALVNAVMNLRVHKMRGIS
jgi:ribosomal protein S4E